MSGMVFVILWCFPLLRYLLTMVVCTVSVFHVYFDLCVICDIGACVDVCIVVCVVVSC